MGWRAEDGGPRRTQTTPGGLHLASGDELDVTTRVAPVVTMVVGDAAGGLHLLRHSAGEAAVSFVERIDPVTLEPLGRSPELPGGPVWPGGVAVHDSGDLHVVFGNHAHRLDGELQVRASTTLPRVRPYNSFVALPDGHLVTKDFGGSLPGAPVAPSAREPCELLVLDPVTLDVVASLVLPEPSIARVSADADDVYVVGDTSLLRVRWDGASLVLDDAFTARYRTMEGQTYGWDCVLAAGAAWFLDDGDGSERFTGTLRGNGLSTAPLHLVRVDVASGEVRLAEVCGLPGGLVANPPVVDEDRGVVVGYDSGNGVVVGFDLRTLEQRWRRDQDHASHLLLYEATGELVTGDGTDVVVLDVTTGDELARADTGAGIQSVLFPAPGASRDFYVCTLVSVSRVAVIPSGTRSTR
jgi:outer membrane protein assembly factor BamB